VLTIRSEQMRALRASSALGYIPSLVAHLQRFHAAGLPKLGAQSVEDFVARAIEAAAGYELYSERSLALFLDIAMVRGLPLPPQVEEILRDGQPASPPERLEKAWRRMMFELEGES
jgi:hypothetical protein